MTSVVFRLPDVGEGIAEVELVKWHVRSGDSIQEGQPLADIMTDKATVELAAPVTGIVEATNGSEGSKLAVGAELAVFSVEGKASPSIPQESSQPKPDAPAPDSKAAPAHPNKSQKVLASPAVRARARSLSLDLSAIPGSGPEGRIEHADLDRLLKSAAPAPSPLPALAPAEPGAEDIKIFGLRRRIAERMSDSKRRIPHFTYVEEIDVTGLEELRKSLNEEDARRPHLTVLPFLIKAIVEAATRHPAVNSHFDDANGIVRRFTSVHAGIATQTERGLLVPVIRNAQAKDLWQIASEIQRLSEEARAGRSDPKELSGSTITVTSLGALGGIMATPIINPPEVAVIGVNRITDRPVVIDGTIVIRKVMNLSSSFDHRIIDGFEAAVFIAEVKEVLKRSGSR
jgi:2-oxoisovalerate dehydrogenase E2 component (dihydrolipoyl transacylase)